MTDTFSKEKRYEIMRAVKSKGNKSTELKLISIFKDNNLKGWRRNYPLFGKPDFVFHKLKVVVFADGCVWHGHNCRNTKPSDNSDYWTKKIKRNKKRDKLVTKTLKNKGWIVVRIWECEINKNNYQRKINKIKVAKSKSINE